MTILRLWQFAVFTLVSISGSKSSIIPEGLECRMKAAAFGGRLVFTDGGGLVLNNLPALSGGRRMVFFQTPPTYLRSHMGFGRGKLWIGNRNCESSASQPGHCPWTADRPCLDDGILCITEPTCYNPSKTNPLQFSQVTEDSITVSWPAWDETIDIGVGPVTGYKILYRHQGDEMFEETVLDSTHLSYRFSGLNSGSVYQFRIVLMRDGEPPECQPSRIQNQTTLCPEIQDVNLRVETWWKSGTTRSRLNVSWELPDLTDECQITHQQITLHELDNDNCSTSHLAEPRYDELENEKRHRCFKTLKPNSLYNITYFVRNSAGSFVVSQVNRTAEAEPSGAPRNIIHETKRRRRVEFSWSEVPCGERNGEITHYEVVALKNDVEVNGERNTVHRKQYIIRHLTLGDQWTFKVRACNAAGCGTYAEVSGEIE